MIIYSETVFMEWGLVIISVLQLRSSVWACECDLARSCGIRNVLVQEGAMRVWRLSSAQRDRGRLWLTDRELAVRIYHTLPASKSYINLVTPQRCVGERQGKSIVAPRRLKKRIYQFWYITVVVLGIYIILYGVDFYACISSAFILSFVQRILACSLNNYLDYWSQRLFIILDNSLGFNLHSNISIYNLPQNFC